jgi:hypothetical protein
VCDRRSNIAGGRGGGGGAGTGDGTGISFLRLSWPLFSLFSPITCSLYSVTELLTPQCSSLLSRIIRLTNYTLVRTLPYDAKLH